MFASQTLAAHPRAAAAALSSSKQRNLLQKAPSRPRRSTSNSRSVVRAYKVTVQDGNDTHVVDVPEGEYILEACMDAGIELPHDCTMGTCGRCSAKLVSGDVDVSAGMISPEAAEKGYLLLCIASPQSDAIVRTIEEEELLKEVLV